MTLRAWWARYRAAVANRHTRLPVLFVTALWGACWAVFLWLLWTHRH